jgi:hypothetical protein
MKKRITAAVLFLVASQLGWAQGGGLTFDGLDMDGDGSVSLGELTSMFAQFGGMGRGGQAPDPEQIFANWDTNGDGMISREEFDNRQPPGGGMGRGRG